MMTIDNHLMSAVYCRLCFYYGVKQMAKQYAKKFYKSKAWQDCRSGYISSVQGLCERCLSKGKLRPGKIVHHIEYITQGNIDDPFITLNWDNLEYVCQDCHNDEHHSAHSTVREDVTFDDDGNLIPK